MTDPESHETASRTDARAQVAAGQRRINLIWELTQALIALSVTWTTLYVTSQTLSETAFALLSNGFFLVIGFYFGRTNHARTGGPGGGDVDRHR